MNVIKRESAPLTKIAEGRQRYLAHNQQMMAVVLEIEHTPATEPDPPHSHYHEQITYVAEGEVNFFLDGEPVRLVPGDMITVPPNVPHCIQPLTKKVTLIDMFTPPREDFLEGK